MSSTVNVGEAERMHALDSQGPNREDPDSCTVLSPQSDSKGGGHGGHRTDTFIQQRLYFKGWVLRYEKSSFRPNECAIAPVLALPLTTSLLNIDMQGTACCRRLIACSWKGHVM